MEVVILVLIINVIYIIIQSLYINELEDEIESMKGESDDEQ